jgi:hypothetical protein
VVIPALVIKLDETDIALSQAPREQTVRGKRAGLARIRAVKGKRGLRFADTSITSGTEVSIR